jgi:hypothetical protein
VQICIGNNKQHSLCSFKASLLGKLGLTENQSGTILIKGFVMIKSSKNGRFSKNAAFLIGFLFLILGSSTLSETSWLYTLAGVLAILQGLHFRYKERSW